MKQYLTERAAATRCALLATFGGLALILTGCAAGGPAERCGLWVDVYRGEPLRYEDVLDDLAEARVIYLGERHTVDWHHALQEQIVRDLIARDVPLVLALEQIEAVYQPQVDRYNAGELTFDELAEAIDWKKRWSNYADYRPIVEAAHASGAPVLALNARREAVRAVAMQGIDDLPAETRAELPAVLDFDDPMYAGYLADVMMVHATVTRDMVDRMFKAQVVRDEMMAQRLAAFLQSDEGAGRVAVVLAGAGHVQQAMGIPSRVRREMPGVRDRIVILSESGDVELSPAMQKMAREITITHEDLRKLDRPIADYLRVRSLGGEAEPVTR
jgi:uncharacterized iron-regulated protein